MDANGRRSNKEAKNKGIGYERVGHNTFKGVEVMKTTRHPTEKKKKKTSFVQRSISYGTKEKEIMVYMLNHPDERFNIYRYSNDNKVPRTTINDALKRMIMKGLVDRPYTGKYELTKKAKDVLNMSDSYVGASRSPCRKEQLSTHYFKYTILINHIDIERLNELSPNKIKPNKLPNFTEYYMYFDDATITVKKNQIIIHIHDLIAEDVDSAHFVAFHKAMDYVLRLKKISDIEGLRVFSKPHYARVESYLSKKLSEIDNKYHLEFKDGTKFWIDYSDKREDETDNALYRKRVDDIFQDAKNSKSVFSDVDNNKVSLNDLKEITKNQVQTVTGLIQLHIGEILPKKKEDISQNKIPEYFG